MKYHINLVSKKEKGVFDKTLYFFLNYFRYILVLTQLVVIGVLFYRFKIDQSIIDLKDSIEQKREIIKVFGPSFQEAGRLNDKFSAIRSIVNDQSTQMGALDYLLSLFPRDAYLRRLSLTNGTYTLGGNTLNSEVLKDYYLTLQKDGRFKNVELSNIKRDESGYIFTLKAGKYSTK